MLDQIDVAFLEDLQRAWVELPPLRRMLGAYLGYKPQARPSMNYHELLAMFPNGKIQ